jgi:hypothetical protein
MAEYTVYGIAFVIALYLVLAVRATEIFFLSVRDGRVLLVRGRVPSTLMAELAEVVARAGVARGSIRAVRQGGAAKLKVGGMDEFVAQRLRNVFGTRSGAELRLTQPPRDRNLGQRLGWAWLAWRLHRDTER